MVYRLRARRRSGDSARPLVVQKLTRRITDRGRSRTTNMMSDHIGGA